MRKTFIISLIILILGGAALAAISEKIYIQGRIDPKPTDGQSITFRIYHLPGGTSGLFFETTKTVTSSTPGGGEVLITEDGIFSLILGPTDDSGRSIPDFSIGTTGNHLEVQVGSDPPMTPRWYIVPVASVLNTKNVIGQGVINLEKTSGTPIDATAGSGGYALYAVDSLEDKAALSIDNRNQNGPALMLGSGWFNFEDNEAQDLGAISSALIEVTVTKPVGRLHVDLSPRGSNAYTVIKVNYDKLTADSVILLSQEHNGGVNSERRVLRLKRVEPGSYFEIFVLHRFGVSAPDSDLDIKYLIIN